MNTALHERMEALAAAYRRVDGRMRGLPLYNPALEVEIVETRSWQDFQLGVLITPWCMNLVLITEENAFGAPAGSGKEFVLPCGRSRFLAGDPCLAGPHWVYSLFSPVLDFPDRAAARSIGSRIMSGVLALPEPHAARDRATNRKLTRREVLGGAEKD